MRDFITILLTKLLIVECCSSDDIPKPPKPAQPLNETASTKPPPVPVGPDDPNWAGVGWGRPAGADNTWGKGAHEPHADTNNRPFEGQPPPQWAYYPKNVGKPSLCLLQPVRGFCGPNPPSNNSTTSVTSSQVRWAFNPFLDRCQSFPFSGCRGNANNFRDEKHCNDICQEPPPPDCNPNGDSVELKDIIDAMYG